MKTLSKIDRLNQASRDLNTLLDRREKSAKMTAETLSEKQIRTIRQSVAGERRSIQIGRSYNSACAGSGTPIKIIDGDASPELIGRPYLKTHFRNHGFRKTLYTYSTLEIAVGSGWIQHQINQ